MASDPSTLQVLIMLAFTVGSSLALIFGVGLLVRFMLGNSRPDVRRLQSLAEQPDGGLFILHPGDPRARLPRHVLLEEARRVQKLRLGD